MKTLNQIYRDVERLQDELEKHVKAHRSNHGMCGYVNKVESAIHYLDLAKPWIDRANNMPDIGVIMRKRA